MLCFQHGEDFARDFGLDMGKTAGYSNHHTRLTWDCLPRVAVYFDIDVCEDGIPAPELSNSSPICLAEVS